MKKKFNEAVAPKDQLKHFITVLNMSFFVKVEPKIEVSIGEDVTSDTHVVAKL